MKKATMHSINIVNDIYHQINISKTNAINLEFRILIMF